MYEVNGIDLSSAEFEFLKGLGGVEGGATFEEDGEIELFRSLAAKGMLNGISLFGAYQFEGLTETGKSFVPDWEAKQKSARRDKMSDRRHDWLVAIVGTAFGYALGVLSSYLTNCFGLLC